MLLKLVTKKATEKAADIVEKRLARLRDDLADLERENRQEMEDLVAEDNLERWQVDRWRIYNEYEEAVAKAKIARAEGWLASLREELGAKSTQTS